MTTPLRALVGCSVAVFGALQGLDVMVTRLELPAVWTAGGAPMPACGRPA